MQTWELLAIAVSLAMDASAVGMATGAQRPAGLAATVRMSSAFGLFQFIMPVIGWAVGLRLTRFLRDYDHWVAFGLLAVVGGHMLWAGLHPKPNTATSRDPTVGWTLLALAVATSIDALAVGVSMSLLGISIWIPAAVIGAVTFALTAAGLALGQRLGAALGQRMDVVGGLVLIAIGVKILAEHL